MAEENNTNTVENNTTENTNIDKNTTPETDHKETLNSEETNNSAENGNVNENNSAENNEEGSDNDNENVDLNNSEEVKQALDKRGLDFDVMTEEYLTAGKLSEKSMKALADAGISEDMVNDYIKGAEARVELERNELAQCVGGREQMETIINWAADNLKKEEIIALNSIRNKFELEAVLVGLRAKMEDKEGKIPDYQKGTGNETTISGFRSQAEMFEAIKNPKYNKDEAYRADIQKKIAASREAGIDLGIY